MLRMTKKTTKQTEKTSNISDYLRFGESYTSLILGIIVVIIAIVLALGILRNRSINQLNNSITQNLNDQTQPGFQNTVSQSITTSSTQKSYVNKKENVYTVEAGDNLWTIAEKEYDSGYNWVDIARANKLLNADILHVGEKLTIPQVAPKIAESEPDIYGNDFSQQTSSTHTMRGEEKVTSDTYTVQTGDNLWNIAVRAYGDGYRWVDLAKVNNLPNPDIIFPNTSLKIPRG